MTEEPEAFAEYPYVETSTRCPHPRARETAPDTFQCPDCGAGWWSPKGGG